MRTWFLTLTICLIAIPAYAQYSGGTGEPIDPYQIATADDLMLLGETPEDYDKHFILTADIDLDPNLPGRRVFDKAVIAPVAEARFTGVFDGNGHTISHLTMIGQNTLGLFGQLGEAWMSTSDREKVSNLGVVDVNITGSGGCIGGLVAENEGIVTRCWSTGTITGSGGLGGLVGNNYHGTVEQCYSTGSVTGTENYVGGLVGTSYMRSSIWHSYSTCRVTGDSNVGGLVGENEMSGISFSRSSGTVTGTGESVGGLLGENSDGGVRQCYSTSDVTGTTDVGGLVGSNGSIEMVGDVEQCYSTGSVTGTGDRIGGLVGYNGYFGSVVMSYSSGLVSGTSDHVGGLVGYCDWGRARISSSFWNIGASGQTSSDGGIGLTTTEMQTASTFIDAGWDFVGETANGTEDIWKITEDLSYPRLSWQKYSGGSGTEADPYQIASAEDLMLLGETQDDYDKHFILTADIDLDPNLPGGKVFDKAVIAPDSTDGFTGFFNGNGHVISHLSVLGEGYLGLFGQLSGKVRSLGLAEVSIQGSGDYVGVLAGTNYGDVTQCYSTGAVSGNNRVGGLVGSNETDGSLVNCWSMGLVRGVCWYPMSWYLGDGVGGLAGANWGTIESCYSAAATSGNHQYVGGLVGENVHYVMIDGSEVNGRVVACFWDTETSGQAMTPWSAGTGKTTAEMQMASTFLEAGWDFLGETENGLHEVWKMPEGSGYPALAIFNGYTPPVLQGFGTAESPYIITDAAELGAIIHYNASAHYRLDASIDMAGIHWPTAVMPSFAGTFDGNSHSIAHLTISGVNYVGMFGRLESDAEIRYLAVVDVNIIGSNEYTGGLVGYSEYSTVTQCYSTGVVRGGDYVGGLMGWNGSGEVRYSYSTATVIGNDHVAGLVSVNSSLLGPGASVIHCYSAGVVGSASTGPWPRGEEPCVCGLVSYHNDLYSGSVIACFWDVETSGQMTSDGGTGKTKTEMQSATTFLTVGWDFVGETENGTEDIWWIDEGNDYPKLWWEAAEQ